jgi:hypothetical protein
MVGQQIQKSLFKKHQLKLVLSSTANQSISGEQRELTPPRGTNIRLMVLDEKFTEDIREACRKHKTTIAAVVIVAALTAVRAVFGPRAERLNKKLPNYQSWVVTSSTRHLLPNSKLLEGGDKETDPSVMEFGGYGGSISNEKFSLSEKHNVWERSRKVKKHLTGSFLRSMRRMKLMNYIYRKPKIWQKIQSKVSLEELTRTYSVEVANLGAWSSPYAPLEVLRKDLGTADWFAGTLNNSFIGARAFFTIALISINNVMSFSVAFDTGSVSSAEGDSFVKALQQVFDQMRLSAGDSMTVEKVLEGLSDGSSPRQ